MRLRVEHTTRFSYDAPVVEAHTELRLHPLDDHGQRCLSFSVETEPRGTRLHQFRDHLDNTVGYFDLLEPHEALAVTSTSEVLTSALEQRTPLQPIERYDYLAPTSFVNLGTPLLVSSSARTGRALELMHAVADLLAYEQGITSVQTSAREVLEVGRGVCQDFAHVLISACRLEGIPARYVSGYLFDDTLASDQGATHAWVDAWEDGRGWVSLDPTHRREQDESYVRVAVGRDYGDVPPTRGTFKGAASETLSVVVRVEPL